MRVSQSRSKGKQGGIKRRFASHDSNSTAGKIADTFREHLNDQNLKGDKYWGNSHECFARALEQYFAYESGTAKVGAFDEAGEKVKMSVYTEKIKPLIEDFLKEKNNLLKSILDDLNLYEEN